MLEWYVNDARGVEQGFTLNKPPVPAFHSTAAEKDMQNDVLRLRIALSTPLIPVLDSERQAVAFSDTAGRTVFNYDKLHVVDAGGETLPAYFVLRDANRMLEIVVDDSRAVYPITVDPLITAGVAKFNRVYANAENYFGYSTALEGNILVVGAYNDEACLPATDCQPAGTAHVFVFNVATAAWNHQAILIADDAAAEDMFGLSVALSGNTIVVGAPFDDDAGLYSGAAYVFARDPTTGVWRQQAKLMASDAAAGKTFGFSVAIDGDIAVVGAAFDNNFPYSEAGSAYVFMRDPATGIWGQQAKLIASDAVLGDRFGWSVAVSGDTALIGAGAADDDGATDSGAAYVFARNGTSWIQQAKLAVSSEPGGHDFEFFGNAVALRGDTALVGAYQADDGGITDSGAVYVFVRDGTSWTRQARLVAADGVGQELFGFSVALDGDTAIVGAAYANNAPYSVAGSAYVFARDPATGVWTQRSKLTASDAGSMDFFGAGVALSGGMAVVGAPYEDANNYNLNATDTGAAYMFARNATTGTWSEQAKLIASDAKAKDHFGYTVALSGDTALVGAPHDDDLGPNYGSATVFVREPLTNTWKLQTKIAGPGSPIWFGYPMALSGDTALVAKYIFVRDSATGNWTQQATLSTGQVVNAVALDGDTALLGANEDDSFGLNYGAVYVFARAPGGATWSQQAKFTASDAATSDDFGRSLVISGNTALVGAPGDDDACSVDAFPSDPGAYCESGSVYVFIREPATGVWRQQAKLTAADAAASDKFGWSVALSGDTALIGAAWNDDACPTDVACDSGSAYVFMRDPATGIWRQQAKLTANDAAALNYFGTAIALDQDTALIGAAFYDDACSANINCTDLGSAYVFIRDPAGGTWSQQGKLTAPESKVNDSFGAAVALSGETALIGAWQDNDGCPADSPATSTVNESLCESGSVYIFDVAYINTAPILDNSGDTHLNSIDEDIAGVDNNGTLVSELIASATGNRITDTESAPPFGFEGIAVTTVDGSNGTWEFFLDDGNGWRAFGTPTESTARLLASDTTTRIRFVPNTNFNTSIGAFPLLTFRAWDRTNACTFPNASPAVCKINGSTGDVSTNAMSDPRSPYSAATETASIAVVPVSDPLEFVPFGNHVLIQQETLEQPYVFQIQVADPLDEPLPNTLLHSFVPLLPWISVNASVAPVEVRMAPTLSTPAGEYPFILNVSERDGYPTNHSVNEELTIWVLPHIPDQIASIDLPYSLDFSKGYPYAGLGFSLAAGGPGSIDAATGVYTWTPTTAGSYSITVRATDSASGDYAEQSVALTVAASGLSATVNTASLSTEDIDTIAVPVLSGSASYFGTTLKHVQVAVQDVAGGLYAGGPVDGVGSFAAFDAAAPVWLIVPGSTGPWNFSTTAVNLNWSLPASYLMPLARSLVPGKQYRVLAQALDTSGLTTAGHVGAGEGVFTYTGNQAYTNLYIQLSATSLLNHSIDFRVDGKLNQMSDKVIPLNGLPITLHVVLPAGATPITCAGGSACEVVTRPDGASEVRLTRDTVSETGQYQFLAGDAGFPVLDREGAYLLYATFPGAPNLLPAESAPQTLLVGASAGYALLVQGKVANGEGLDAHHKTSERIYEHLKRRGFLDENIAYYSYSPSLKADGAPGKAALQQALAGLAQKMAEVPAPLYLIFIDHGSADKGFILGEETLSPGEVDAWLDAIEGHLQTAKPAALDKPRVLVVGACYSGQFVQPVSAPGRLVVTSAAADEVSYKGPQEPDGVRSGELFMEEFFQHLMRGASFKRAFEDATALTENATRAGDAVNSIDPNYNDPALQHPQLDDNGDGHASNQLYPGGDGSLAQDFYLGAVLPSGTNYGGAPAEILAVTETCFLGPDQTVADLWIQVNDAGRVNLAPVDIRLPGTVLAPPTQLQSIQQDLTQLVRVPTLTCNYSNLCTGSTPALTQSGRYELFYFVLDSVTGEVSPIKRSLVYKDAAGNLPPYPVQLLSPADGGTWTETAVLLDWQSVDLSGTPIVPNADNSNLDQDSASNPASPVTYSLVVAKDSALGQIVYVAENLDVSMSGIPNGVLLDNTTYYWRVYAIDSYGATTPSPVYSFTTDFPNVPANLATISVVSAVNYGPLDTSGASLSLSGSGGAVNPPLVQDYGQYSTVLPAGQYTANVSLPGYTSASGGLDLSQGGDSVTLALTPQGPGSLQFSTGVMAAGENGLTLSIAVERVGGVEGTVSVSYASQAGDALEGQDYGAASGVLSWGPNDAQPKNISVNLYQDTLPEGDESFSLVLSSPQGGAVLGARGQVQVTIVDDEPALPGSLNFASPAYVFGEDAGTVSIPVNRGGGGSGAVTVDYSLHPASTADANDASNTGGTLSWVAGDTAAKNISLGISDDTLQEGSETLVLQLQNPTGGATLGTQAQTVVTLVDNDAAQTGVTPPASGGSLQFTQTLYSADENAGSVTVSVGRTGGTGGVTVGYASQDGSAVAGGDYGAVQGTLSWGDGDLSPKSFTVTLVADNTAEGIELANLRLGNPSGGAVLGSPSQATLAILDNSAGGGTQTVVAPPDPCPLAPVLNSSCDAAGQHYGDLQISAGIQVSNLVLDGQAVNAGSIGNLALGAQASLSGGSLSGLVINNGTLSDIAFQGGTLLGGTLAGTISNNGTIQG